MLFTLLVKTQSFLPLFQSEATYKAKIIIIIITVIITIMIIMFFILMQMKLIFTVQLA